MLRSLRWVVTVLALSAACQPGQSSAVGAKPRYVEPTEKNRPTFRKARVVVQGQGGDLPLSVEVAEDDPQRAYGLMFKKQMGDDEGMIFLFDETREHIFWMKNTFIPLDMVFIGDDRRVEGVYENAEPFSLQRMTVQKPSRYVLEVNAGWCRQHGVGAGAQLRFDGVEK
jgi:uncharacterized membrane protein (UPF0127 family)